MITLTYLQLALIIFCSIGMGAIMLSLFVADGNAERQAEEMEKRMNGHF